MVARQGSWTAGTG